MKTVKILLLLQESLRANGICRILENISHNSQFNAAILESAKVKSLLNKVIYSDILFIENNPELICLNEFIEKAKSEKPELKIICLLENEDNVAARYLFKKGADGIISVKAKEEEYREAVAAILNNYYYNKKKLTRKETHKSLNNIPLLSDREFEVFTLSNKRFKNNEIAEILGISYKTVKNHKSKIKEKLGDWDF